MLTEISITIIASDRPSAYADMAWGDQEELSGHATIFRNNKRSVTRIPILRLKPTATWPYTHHLEGHNVTPFPRQIWYHLGANYTEKGGVGKSISPNGHQHPTTAAAAFKRARNIALEGNKCTKDVP